VLLVFGHEAGFQGPNAVLGALLVFGSAISYAIYLVYSGEMVKRLGSLRLVGLATSVACVLCLLQFVLLRTLDEATAVAPEVIWLSVLNATLCTFAPVIMVMMGIERIGAGLAAQTGMIGPMSSIAMGVLSLDVPFNGWIIAGTVLVVSGVFLVTRAGRASTAK
jgi:drug/metabolite transporter (DMT)-like permease